ncbi:MAG TPA: FkbM family methyltransferase [Prosthecobacter sp.]|nr:FkbM family methyltransferase [Prosthecobacter sp.]
MNRRQLANLLRPWLERLGIASLSRPALHGIDRRLAQILPQRGGWFLEAGANDGFQQSNTYYLERFRGWHGVLVEPEPSLAAMCRRRRPRASVLECALGSPETADATIELRCAGLMSHVRGALGHDSMERERAAHGLALQGLPPQERTVTVPVRTLTEVLDQAAAPAQPDLLSIDVEGYELEVLKGLDLRRYQPKAICIEVRTSNLEEVRLMLARHYHLKEVLHAGEQHGDYLFILKSQSTSSNA